MQREEITAGITARTLVGASLAAALLDAHRHTWSILADLEACRSAIASGWRVPELPGINPPLWEYGHLAWFAEWWILRDAQPDEKVGGWTARRPSMLADADRWFDSARVAHDLRWRLDLPPLSAIRGYVARVLDAVRAKLADEPRGIDQNAALYPYRLALFHEDMHGEALQYLRQTLDYPASGRAVLTPVALGAELAFGGGRFAMGASSQAGFAFDNEVQAHEVEVEPFAIDRDCVANRDYVEFVESGGYRDARLWSTAGRTWLQAAKLDSPTRWRRSPDSNGERQQLWFGQWQALPLDHPVCHVNAFEAEAYCVWAGRRLPSEAEWECAATDSANDSFFWGNSVWEWTADSFAPYPGFVPDRYREYSEPWFHTHRSVRGASFATRARMRHPRYRNFYLPERCDLFVGFRSCRL